MTLPVFVLLAFAQSAGSTPSLPPPAPQQPTAPSAPAATDVDPAKLVFPVDTSGVVLITVKADRTADYEAMIRALHEALAAADPAARRIGQGWRIYKAADSDAKGNALYVHVIAAALADADYRPSVVLSRLVRDLPAELLVKYREALAGATMRLSLALVADLSLAPVVTPKD